MTSRRNSKLKSAHKSSRRSRHETLERRELLAAELDGPRLIAVSANSGQQFDLQDNNVLSTSPSELKFRFGGDLIDAATLAGLQFQRSGGDGDFNSGNEQSIVPGYLGFEDDDGTNIIVARFAESLPDDQYIATLAGFDDTSAQIVGVRDVDGDLLRTSGALDPLRPVQLVRFEVEIGPRVVSVVPQPIEGLGGSRIQNRNQIHVYFNDDPLSNPLAGPISSATSNLPVVNPNFYKLIYTENTVENTDDTVILPTQVSYDPTINRATLTFPGDLAELAPAAANNNSGTYRLRIGRADNLPDAPIEVNSNGGGEDTFDEAISLGVNFGGGTQSVVVTEGLIQANNPIIPDWPGAYDAPGLRDNRRDVQVTGQRDTNVGINVFPYNFARIYGSDPQGNTLENAITQAQQQRFREVLDFYSERLGVEFVETEDQGLQIVTGDLRSIVITADTGAGADTPLSIYRVNERDQTKGLLVLDAGENWFDGYGLSPDNRLSYFVEALRGVGELLGIGDLFEQPQGVAAGGSSPDEPNSVLFSDLYYPNLPAEPDFLSQSDITLGQGLHRPESNDVDFYSFTADASGELSIVTIAERLDGSSLLDTHLQLYRINVDADTGDVSYEMIAKNDDFFSEDSFIGLDITPGDYIVGVSASGNDQYNGEISGSGLGGVSEGRYELRLTFKSSTSSTITDTTGTQLDGDADGVEGGEFNYWFRVARDSSTAGPQQPRTIFVDKLGDDTNDGSLGAPMRTIRAALAASSANDIVRILPNAGTDGLISTQQDNLAYEIGVGGATNSALSDGAEFIVPRGVAVQIDAGALFKLKDAKISVGSETVDEDRSLASLQVLGTPVIAGENGSGEVFFTSWDDESLGVDTNPLPTSAQPGQWAGIEFRNDFDYSEGRPVWETEGIFLDFVSHANMQYGGGSVDVTEPIVTPLQMNESRPTLIYNTIRNSADAAISADPDSFLETNFTGPLYQRAARFTSDYDRVGPELTGNRLIGNSINGLFVRVETPAAGELEPMTVSGRFDDQDIVHVISQVLVLQGQPGGALLMEDRPDVLSVTVNPLVHDPNVHPPLPQLGERLDAFESYNYRVTYVDADGNESLASLPTATGLASSDGGLRLRNLPSTPIEFVGRKLYRSIPGSMDYEFVVQLDRVTTTYNDFGVTRGGLLASETRPNAAGVVAANGPGGSLTTGQAYDYRFTFYGANGGETRASQSTASFVAPDSGGISLSGIPVPPAGFESTRVYRSIPGTSQHELVIELSGGETSFNDNGRNVDLPQRLLDNNGEDGAKLLPRFDARLSIDPGLIVKLQSSRIQAQFGADFYAEGIDGNEIVFTSRRDDTFGTGGTFDTNNDGIANNAAPGDWGGLVFRQDSTGSLDYTRVSFGGGSTASEGQFTEFNAIEILQSDVRIANSTITDNASGFANRSIRDGIGFNDDAAIFVRGSQPIIVGNTIESNEGAAISINPNSLTPESVLDHGRSTGALDLFGTDMDNQGPLVAANSLNGNTFNGMRVRSEVLTTDSTWDDTDIVHVVEGQIISMTNHFQGALRLQSDPSQSLVVKLGNNAELIGTGRPLDIDDRIGGTLQILGTPGNPVILTSLSDSTVGAGFTPDGRPNNETVVSANGPAAGDWGGLRLDTFINDRNVAYVLEQENADAASGAVNSLADNAQVIGNLADREYAGDENERLGFNVRGTIAATDDQDVYSFTATGGTGVYIDIDRTSVGLDSVLELIDVNDNVLARSDSSFLESMDPNLLSSILPDGTVQPLYQVGLGNVESPNAHDAGMRVILPGSNNQENTYFVRVRSNGLSTGSYQLSIRLREVEEVAGSTIQLADIRYATDAITVNSAPLHSPLTGTAAESLNFTTILDPTPGNPQSGDEFVQEAYNNRLGFTTGQVDRLGNLGSSDRGSLVVSGDIGNISSFNADIRLEDVDVYQVDLFTQQIEPDVFDSENRFITTTFDIDYADGLGRPNTSLAVYDITGTLIAHSRDSNVADDTGRPLQGVDMANLDGGSAGALDAYIGPIELPEGTYFVAVSNAAAVPTQMDQFFNPNPANTNTRLVPINSVRRLGEDTFDDYSVEFFSTDFNTPLLDEVNYTSERPIIEPTFDLESLVPYTLDDMKLFISLDSGYSGTNQSSIVSVNPVTGVIERLIGQSGQPTGDLAAREDGELFAYSHGPQTGQFNSGNIGNYLNISPVNGAANNNGDDGIGFRQSNQNGNGTEIDQNGQLIINGLAFRLPDNGDSQSTVRTAPVNANAEAFVIGERDTNGRGFEIPDEFTRNILYEIRQGAGVITSLGSVNNNAHRNFPQNTPYLPSMGPASEDIEWGIVDTGFIYDTGGDAGDIHGIAYDPDNTTTLWAATDNGGIHSFSYFDTIDSPAGTDLAGYTRVIPTTFHGVVPVDPAHQDSSFFPITAPEFSSLAFGPRTIEGESYRQTLFMTTSDGWIYAANIDNNGRVEPANVFYNGRYAIPITFPDDFGFTFLPDVHGLAFGNQEVSAWHQTGDRNLDDGHGIKDPYDNSRQELAGRGLSSLYYGFEINPGTNNGGNNPQGNTISRPDGDPLGELAPGGSHGTVISRPINLEGYSSADKPTLYFSYFMEVENPDDYLPGTRLQRDSFRVFGAGDDGEWKLLATNNDFRALPLDDEYDYFNATNIPVQELFDDSNAWRQARVDLGPLAGNENVRIRFDFSTAGAMRTHFDSIELVAIPGDEVVDGELVSFNDEDFNQVLLESVVGTEAQFPSGADVNIGDVIQLSGPGVGAAVAFVSTGAGPGRAVISPTMTPSEVAAAVVAAVDQTVSARIVGGGRVRFEAVTSLQVFGDTLIGEVNPVLVQRIGSQFSAFGEAPQVIIPDGNQILPGDSITIFSSSGVDTFTFVEVSTGAPGEVIYSRTQTADEIARQLFSQLPLEAQAIYEGNGLITFLDTNVQVQESPASPSILDQTADTPVDEGRIEIAMPSSLTLDPNEIITVDHAEGTTRILLSTFPQFNVPFGVTNVVVPFFATAAEVADFVRGALPNSTGAFVTAFGDLSVVAASVTVASSDTALSIGPATGRVLTIPSGLNLTDGEQLSIVYDDQLFELTFVESPLPGPPGQVSYQPTDTANDIALRVAAAINAGSDVVVAADQITFYGASITLPSLTTTSITSTTIDAQEIVLPDAFELTDQETIDIDVGGVLTTLTFVAGPEPGGGPLPGDVHFEPLDTGDVIAARVVAQLSALGFNPVVVDGAPLADTVRFTADSATYSGQAPVATAFHATNAGDVLVLPITDVSTLRSGLELTISQGFFGFGPTVGFVQRGDSIRPNTDVVVYFDRNAFDLDAELASVYEQLIDGLSPFFEVYVDPLGRGFVVNDSFAQSFVFTEPTEILLDSREVNEAAIPLTLPAASDIVEGETVTVTIKGDVQATATVELTFVTQPNATGAPGEIVFDPAHTATELADSIVRQLPTELEGYRVGARQIYLLGAQSVEVSAGSDIISYQATNSGIAPILVDTSMTTREVAERLRIAINEAVGQFVQTSTDDTPIHTYATYGGDRIRLYQLTPTDVGSYGVSGYDVLTNEITTSPVPADEFGVRRSIAFAGSQQETISASNNVVEGVYLDDIIIGFAERGEMVLEANSDQTFVFNPETLPDTHPQAIQPERQNEALLGPYALEIRTSDAYGVPQDYDPINLEIREQSSLGRSFDTNDRLTDGAVSLIAEPGTSLLDGDTFVLSDGWRQLTFEFDSTLTPGVSNGNVPVVFDPAETDAAPTARAIRNAINSPQAQNVLNITAATSDGFETAVNTGNRVELFGSSSITVNPAGGRFLIMDLVAEETSQGRETSRQIPLLDQVAETVEKRIFGDELDRSTPTGFVNASFDTLVGVGKIGDQVVTGEGVLNIQDGAVVLGTSPSVDFDSVRIYLNAGDTVDIDVDTLGFSRAGEILDLPVISVYDAGDTLTEDLFGFSIDRTRQTSLFEPSFAPGETDPGAFLAFTAPESGFYDVVISSAAIFGQQFMSFFDFGGFSPSFLYDGETILIASGTSQVTYEYTTDPNLVSPNVLIVLDNTDTGADIAAKTAAAITANQSEILQADVDGVNINLIEVAGTVSISSSSFFISAGFRGEDYGEYALTIRPNVSSGNVPARDVLMVDYQFGIGDTNRTEDQGQLVISSNFISDSSGTGVRAVSDQRGERLVNNNGVVSPDALPQPGSARLLRNQNSDALIPGVVIINNVIAHSGDAAVEFGGDVNTNGNVPSPAAFGRIVNNTIVNESSGDGIRISGASSPTVLNNIITGFNNGVVTTGNQFGDVVVGGNAFQDNTNNSNVGLSTSSFVIPTGVPLFQDPTRGIYIPATGSDVIDSSFASLSERSEFFQTVKQPAGISPSPIIAPEFDAYGQARVDDPLVQTPGGVGSNVFIDRGAIDRADDVRPSAVLTGPLDAIGVQVDGGDRDPDASFVRLNEGTLSFFEVQLIDPSGTGIDPQSVNTQTVILTENGVRLTPGRDYVFGYSSNSNTIRLTPLTGIWRPDAVYEITLNNKQRIEVTLPSGDQISDGSQITIGTAAGQSVVEFDSGFSLVIPQTLTLSVEGTNASFNDGELITITSPGGVSRDLEFDTDGTLVNSGAIPVDIRNAGTIQDVRDAILTTLNSVDPGSDPQVSVAAAVGLNPVAVSVNEIQLGTVSGHTVSENAGALSVSGAAGGVQAGDTLFYATPNGQVTFEFTDTVVSDPTFVAIPFTATETADQIAATAAAVIAGEALGLGAAQAVGGGRVAIGGAVGDTASVSSASVILEGTPGVAPGNIPLVYVQSDSFTPAVAAAALQNAIRGAGLGLQTFNPGGGTLFISGATTVSGVINGTQVAVGSSIPAITDLAGNRVRETRITDETRFTIIMPEVVFDFGDAPVSYGTLFSGNGARHTISGDRLPRLGIYLDNEVDGQPAPGSDDATLPILIDVFGSVFTPRNVGPNQFTITADGGAPAGGEQVSLTIGGRNVTFELIRATENPSTGNVPIVFATNEPLDSITQKLFLAIRASFDVIGSSVLMDLNGDTITLEAIDDEDGVSIGTFVSNSVSYQVFTAVGTNPNNVGGEDVVGFLNPLDPAGSTIPITVTGSGLVDIWVDFDRPGTAGAGTFEEDELIAPSVPVVDGVNFVNVQLPANAVNSPADTWMRVRLSQSGNLTPTGVAVGGEVEDYIVSVVPIALPTPIDDTYDAIEDTALVIDSIASQDNLLANDLDIDIQLLPVRYFIGQDVQNGTLTVTNELTGEFTYVPNPDYYGTDTFTYRLSTQQNAGASAAGSVFATVTINVAPVNDTPGVSDKALVGLEDNLLTIDASTLLAGATGHGNPQITNPPQDESIQGLRLISVSAGGTTINVANQSGTAVTPEGATLSAAFDIDPMTGRTFITEVYYSPALDFNSDNLPLSDGSPRLDEFTFTIEDDGRLELDDGSVIDSTPLPVSATATVRVTPQNDAPTPATDTASIINNAYRNFYLDQGLTIPVPTEDESLTIPADFLIANDLRGTVRTQDETDGIGGNDGPLRISSVSVDPQFGTIQLLPTGDVFFTPADDVYGRVEFTYEVTDQGINEDVAGNRVPGPLSTTITSTIFLEPVNDVPVAYDRSLRMTEAVEPNGPAVLSFTANDLISGRGVIANSPIATETNSITLADGADIIDGETAILTRTGGTQTIVEFSTSLTASTGTDILITFSASDSASDVAASLAAALNAAGINATASGAVVDSADLRGVATGILSASIVADDSGITVPHGSMITGGESIRLVGNNGQTITLELSTSGVPFGTPDVLVNFSATDDEATVIAAIQAALTSVGIGSNLIPPSVAGEASLAFTGTSVSNIANPASLITAVAGTLTLPDAIDLIDGETITVDDGAGTSFVLEFNTTGVLATGSDEVVQYNPTDLADTLAVAVEGILRARNLGGSAIGGGAVELNSVASGSNFLPSTSIVGSPSLTFVDGVSMVDGQTVVLTDSEGIRTVVEFSTSGTPSIGTDILITYFLSNTAEEIATNLASALVPAGLGGVVNGPTVHLPVVTSVVTSTFSTMISGNPAGITVPNGSMIVGGETIEVTGTNGQTLRLEMSTSGVPIGSPDRLVDFTPADDEATVIAAVQAALTSVGIGSNLIAGAPGLGALEFSAVSITAINDPNSLITTVNGNLVLPDAIDLVNGETIVVADGLGTSFVLEFNTTGVPSVGTDEVVQYDPVELASTVALSTQAVLRSRNLGATASGGGTVEFNAVNNSTAIAPTTSITGTPTDLVLPAGSQLIDGETVELTIDGQSVVIEFNTTGVASAGTTYLVNFSALDSADSLAANLQIAMRNDGIGVTAIGDTLHFSNADTVVVTELRDVAGDFAEGLPTPYNETEQTLRVVTFETTQGLVDADVVVTGTATLATDNGGLLELTFSGGVFVNGTYTPPIDYNEQPPFIPTDLFTYSIADNGRTTLPFSGLVRDLADERSVESATVTISVTAANDVPVFDSPAELDILEDSNGAVIPDVVTNVTPSALTALDELATQTVSFSVIDVDVPVGLMDQTPVVLSDGSLNVFPSTDAVGTAVYVIRGTDDHPTDPQFTDATITINVRPVNDAPRFDPNVAGTSGINTPDNAYSVARVTDPQTGEIVDATITYTLREDNTQALGFLQPYFIPLARDPNVVGYNRVGLLDVFNVGPGNEADGTLGGMQSLDLFDFPSRTDLGGTLTEVFDVNNNRIGLEYTPPLNYNFVIGGTDSFQYTVQDGSVAGETWDLSSGGLVSDPMTSSNSVEFILNPVNDRPEFEINLLREVLGDPTSDFRPIETTEDSDLTVIGNFTFNINAAPPATAFDEVDVVNGQSVRFSVTSLGFPESQASDFFSVFPQITPEGQLSFQPAPDVFGSFEFEVVLTDDGPGNATRGDLISSLPQTITIDVLPVNDAPIVIPGSDPLAFTLNEDTSFEVPINGDTQLPGLLDVFQPGPDNEATNITPGGNQTVTIKEPTPLTTASGGTLERVLGNNGELVALRYIPRANFVGMDSFIYTVTDDGTTVDVGTGGVVRQDPRIASNTVSFEVLGINDPPQFSGAASVTINEDAGPVTVSNWATNVNPGPITAVDELASQSVNFVITQLTGPTNLFSSVPVAVVEDNNTATLQFQPAGDANGVATFSVQAFDDGPSDASAGHNNASPVRTFTIRVNPINDPPTFTPGNIVVVDEDSGPYANEWATDVSPGPSDESSQSVRFEVTTPADATGLFQQVPQISDDGTLRFIPAANANGIVDLTVTAIDSGGAASTPITLRIVIDPVNDTPVAVADDIVTDEDTILVIPSSQLLSNDVDPDIGNPDDTLTIVRPVDGFSASGARVQFDPSTGDLTYDPTTSVSLQSLAPGETAVDSFSYSVIDSQGASSNLAIVELVVNGINDAPVARADNPTLNPDGPTVIAVLANDSDVDGTLDPTSIEITLDPAFGSLSIDSNGIVTFTAFQSFALEDQFRYTVADDLGERSESVLVTIAANAAPNARDDQAVTYLNEFADINVAANDIDPDAAPGAPNGGLDLTSIEIASGPVSGSAVPRADGTVRYIPNDGFTGRDTFTYTIADSEGRRSLPATVDVRVSASRLQNPNLNADVNNDGNVSPIDALLVINLLARSTTIPIPVTEESMGPPFYDVNGDQQVGLSDALAVINELARRSATGPEGEGVSAEIASADSTVADDAVVSGGLIDLIADDQDDDEKEERIAAVDVAFGDLI